MPTAKQFDTDKISTVENALKLYFKLNEKTQLSKQILKILLIAVIVIFVMTLLIPGITAYRAKHRIYPEFSSSAVFNANIRLVSVVTQDNSTSYGAGCSGVVFRHVDNTY